MVQAQAFGRFGYASSLTLPGFTLDREGFTAVHPAADRIRFGHPSDRWKPLLTSSTEQTVSLQEFAGNPSKVRVNLLAPGFSVYFPQGIVLRLTSTAAPYLTWREGSASSGVPTPDVKWAVLSFRDAQPPLIFGFQGNPASLQVTGKPGAWTVQSAPGFQGWVRVGLPVGQQADAANSAAALGRLAKAAEAEETLWTQPTPVTTSLTLAPDEDGVLATWKFDRRNAQVPLAVSMAALGGYPLKVLSPIRRVAFTLDQAPIDVCTERELSVRFPIRRVPNGRGLALNATLSEPLGTISPIDIPSVVELALETMTSTRDVQTRKVAEQTIAEYLGQATYVKEPWSDQTLPYAVDGNGIDLAAAQSLLMQAIAGTTNPSSQANSLLTSVAWRRDWATWMPWVEDPARRRRAAALAALAGAMCPEPERRLAAGMFQAGLSGERGLQIWQRRRGLISKEVPLLEPMAELREGLFRLQGNPGESDTAFVEALLSPVRVYGDAPARVFLRDKDLILEWPALEPKASIMNVTAAYEVSLEPLANLPRFEIEKTFGSNQMMYTPETTGTCQVKLTLPAWAKPLPKAAIVPKYSEPSRT